MKVTEVKIGNELLLETENGVLSFRYASLGSKEGLVVSNISESDQTIKVRIHSSCVFGEAFHVVECDCSDQLNHALESISNEGGVIIYLFEEGRGVGLQKKIEAIKLQKEKGINTVEAFKALGFQDDERNFELAVAVLNSLYYDREIELITNNPLKVQKVKEAGLKLSDVKNSVHVKNDAIKNYLIEKRDFLGHQIELEE